MTNNRLLLIKCGYVKIFEHLIFSYLILFYFNKKQYSLPA